MDALCLSLLHGSLLLFLCGAVAGVILRRRERLASFASFGLAAAGSTLLFICSWVALVWPGARIEAAASVELWPSLVPYLRVSVKLDGLSAFFCLVLAIVGLALSIYSLGYARGFYGRKPAGFLAGFYNLLLLATQLVFIADNAFFFLTAWEIMALTAYCLVSFEHEQAQTRRAGVLYFIMSHVGTGCLVLAFLLLFQASGNYDFGGFHLLGEKMSNPARGATFLLFLVGFGVKAGVVPLHIWLPAAHPVAPSNVSALLSGVLIKTGIYGLTRAFFDFLGAPPLWWGVTVLSIGTVSALVGVLYALMQHDLKTLLAYHSIENIGIILMGLGAALIFSHTGHPVLSGLALVAGLYHTLNHAVFKALLFLGAGAVLHSAHTRDMEQMGGLIKRMPFTAGCFLLGAAAISALPPLNGFVSEWLTYQALLQGFGTTGHLVRLIFPLSGAMLALTSALAAACFVKAFGISFLAQPRSEAAARAQEASAFMLAGQAILASVCVLFGLFPNLVLRLLDPVTQQLVGQQLSARLALAGGLVLGNLEPAGGSVSTLGLSFAGALLLVPPFLLWLLFSRRAKVRVGPTWDCGLRSLSPQMEYSATGFSKPIRMIFKALFRPRREVQREYDYSPYFARTIRFESAVEEVFEKRVYRPFQRGLLRLSRRVRALQAGSIQAYLIYIFVTIACAAARSLMKAMWISAVLQTVLLLGLAPFLTGCIRNWKAKLQNRRGPPPWQPYLDLLKYLRKDMVISEHASWIFRAAPYVVFVSALLVGLMVPMLTLQAPLSLFGGALAVIGLLALGRFFLALAGLDTASAFGGMGSSREMTLAAVAEPALMLAIFTVALSAGSTDLSGIMRAAQAPDWNLLNPTFVLAFAAMFIVLLAETGRVPVDNPATHLELTMIHEAMILEYSGRYLAFMEWGASIKQLVLMALLVNVFVPVGLAAGGSAAALGLALVFFAAKLLVLAAAVVLVETTNAKLRLFRVPDLLSAAFVLAALALLSTFIFK